MERGAVTGRAQFQPRRAVDYIMPRSTRSSWGSNKPARRKGYRTLRYWADEHDGRGYMRHTMTIEGSKRDGDRKLAELRLAHSDDRPVPTLRECYESWCAPDVKSRLSYNSVKMYESAWRSKIEPRWGDSPVTDIKPIDVQGWISGMTRSQATLVMKVMAATIDYAVRYGILDSNPMRVRYVMPTSGRKRDGGTYTLDESVAIFRAVRGSFIEAAVLSSLFGSCRVGESLSPRVGELVGARAENGMTAAMFDLKRQVANNGDVVGDLKTDGSKRTIVFVGEVAERMLEIQEQRHRDGLAWLTDNGLGEHVEQRVLSAEWRKLLSASGIPHHPYQNLRNSWRTFMDWELHVEPSKLEKMMGHRGGDVTAIHYNRPTAQMYIDSVAEAYKSKGVLC